MTSSVQSVRGMLDTLPPDSARWLAFENRCRELFGRYGYQEIRTPVVEHTALFARGMGESTDVVEKQMYTFADRKGRSLTMRPEMTAGCARAYVEHTIAKQEPVTRWMYSGPMFRYERVQGGRYRQFYQVGVEAFGVAEPTVEAEQIAMLCALYEGYGLRQTTAREHAQGEFCVLFNTVGTAEDRPRYREALVAHLQPHAAELCEDCRRRLDTNPLRVLDCKIDGDKEVVRTAPAIHDYLGPASRSHFDAAQAALTQLGVSYAVDPHTVRGLDYYTGPVFEIIAHSDELGRTTTIVAGGRYDGLVESLGGPRTPAVGFSIGTERNVFYALRDALPGPPAVDAMIATHGDVARLRGIALASELRRAGFHIEVEHRAVGMKAQFKRADKIGARRVIALGDAELADGTATVRDMASRTEVKVPLGELAAHLGHQLAP